MVSIICTTKNIWKLEKTWRPNMETQGSPNRAPLWHRALRDWRGTRGASSSARRKRVGLSKWIACLTTAWHDPRLALLFWYIILYCNSFDYELHFCSFLQTVFLVSRVARAAFVSGFETCFLIIESGIKTGESVEAWWVDGWRRQNGVTLIN